MIFPNRKLPIQKIEDTKRFGEYYNENRFWKKIKRIAKKTGGTALRPILLLYYTMQDGNVPIQEKIYIIGALGYFILPIDLIPDFLLGLGYTDDLAVITLLLNRLKNIITPEIEERVALKINELLKKEG